MGLTVQDYNNFMENHAFQLEDGFWKVTTPIPAFKKVLTYPCTKDRHIVICPHDDATEREFIGPSLKGYVCFYDTTEAIANLVIPKGAIVKAPHLYGQAKLRANKALVHSVVRLEDRNQVLFGLSAHDRSFVYINGQMVGQKIEVKPEEKFSRDLKECGSGIHFFLDLNQAKNY